MSKKYQYYAVVTKYHPSVEEPDFVARQWIDERGAIQEERYTSDLRWVPSNAVDQFRSGKRDGQVHLITEEAGLRFEQIQAERTRADHPADGKYNYLAIVDDGYPLDSPRKVLRTWTSPEGYPREQAYVHESGWYTSQVLNRIGFDRESGEPVLINEEAVERFKPILAERMRRAQPRDITYRYYAIVDDSHTVNDPLAVVRQWNDNETGEVSEEEYSTDIRWVASDLVQHHQGEAVPIDADAVEQFEILQVKRWRQARGLT